MNPPCNREDRLLAALIRHKIIASHVTIQEREGEATVSFRWLGLRRYRRHGSYIKDEPAEMRRRLCGILPGLSDVSQTIDQTGGGRRWILIVQCKIPTEELDDSLRLQPEPVPPSRVIGREVYPRPSCQAAPAWL
jgi:hypothetical protein